MESEAGDKEVPQSHGDEDWPDRLLPGNQIDKTEEEVQAASDNGKTDRENLGGSKGRRQPPAWGVGARRIRRKTRRAPTRKGMPITACAM